MTVISTSQLRTNIQGLISALENGETVHLIHRSAHIGDIKPHMAKMRSFDAKKFQDAVDAIAARTKGISDEQAEKNYREHMEQKYGDHFS